MELDFDLDGSLPPAAGAIVQTAVVFTALDGPHKGELTYLSADEYHSMEWLRWYASEYLPPEANARLMTRSVTTGPWWPA